MQAGRSFIHFLSLQGPRDKKKTEADLDADLMLKHQDYIATVYLSLYPHITVDTYMYVAYI